MTRLVEIEKRKGQIRELLQGEAEINLDELETELRALDVEKVEIEKRQKTANDIQTGAVEYKKIEKQEERTMDFTTLSKDEILSTQEYRSGYLKKLQGKGLTDAEQRALTNVSGSAGAAVPTVTLDLIIDKLRQTSVLFTKVAVSFVPGNLSFVVANAKNAAAWKAQGTNGTAADDTVTSVSLTGHELIKLVEVSAATASMTIDAFESYIVEELGRQLAIAIENAILNGSGTNQPTGILTGVTFDSSNATTWANNALVGYDNIVDGLALLPTMYHNTAVFVLNRKTLFGGIRKIKATDGQPIFTYNAQDKAAMTLLGYPVILDDYIADDIILLGDFNYYKLNFAQAPIIETSREASFSSGKITYRGLAVADGKPALSEAFVKISKAPAS